MASGTGPTIPSFAASLPRMPTARAGHPGRHTSTELGFSPISPSSKGSRLDVFEIEFPNERKLTIRRRDALELYLAMRYVGTFDAC